MRFTLLVVCFGLAGCGNRGVEVPKYSPAAAAQAAFAEYDTNRDGTLDPAELERCASLKSFARRVEKKQLTLQDLEERLTAFLDSKTGTQAVGLTVHWRGAPLVDATVTFVPEKFLGDYLKPAAGKSDKNGAVQLKRDDGVIGAAPGYYRIEVSKKDGAGNETIPARYNSATVLGEEVSSTMRGGILLKLSD